MIPRQFRIVALAALLLVPGPGSLLAQEGEGGVPGERKEEEPAPPATYDVSNLFIGRVEMGEEATVRIDYEFEDEAELLDWERMGEEHKLSSGRLGLDEGSGLIHKMPFAREMRVDVKARRLRTLTIELAGNGESEGTGFRVAITPGRPGRLEVIRAGDTWADEELDASGPKAVSVAYEGGALVVEVDGAEVFRRADAEPPPGSRILVGGGEKSVQLDTLTIRAGYEAMAVRNAGLKRPLPPGRWIPFIDETGFGDFATGKGWTAKDRVLTYSGAEGSQGWSVFRSIDVAELDSYVLELQVRQDSGRWKKGRDSGYVYVGFGMQGLASSWGFSGEGSRVGQLDSTGRPKTFTKGKWHQLRIVVQGGRAEGFFDGVQSWAVADLDAFREYEDPERRWFGFGGSLGPLHFRNIRLMVSAARR